MFSETGAQVLQGRLALAHQWIHLTAAYTADCYHLDPNPLGQGLRVPEDST